MMRLTSISVPAQLQRNDPEIVQAGIENGGEALLQLVARRLGRTDLSGIDFLDVGCGVRFTQTIINRHVPIGSYTGVEVYRPIIDWLKEHVEREDDRFTFVHWDAHNPRYNSGRSARRMESFTTLPVEGTFDVIAGFSLFTHLAPGDTEQMMRLMRKAVRPGGHLFFSALCQDQTVETYKEAKPDRPGAEVHYGRSYLETIIAATGWELVSCEAPSFFIVDSFLCRPARDRSTSA